MASNENREMDFAPMTSISKKADPQAHKCSDWVATEKVHGSSFQVYTDDGVNLSAGSRRRNLDDAESFIRCNIKELLKKYKDYALKTWHIIHSEDRWESYRDPATEFEDEDDEGSDNDGAEDNDEEVDGSDNVSSEKDESVEKDTSENDELGETCRVRIYGELYGGGGVKLPIKSAAQKEIIYCDEFRFYVFGITINKKWVNIYELNDLCREAGFPYYAKPVCEPRSTMDELKEHLVEIGFMVSRSSLTEKEGDDKTNIEGVVMTPIKRPDYKLRAVKFLASAFTDVKEACFGITKTANFCTKQRYHSVISKLDIDERKDTKMVVNMFIEDILKESQLQVVGNKLKEKWGRIVMDWLAEDEYDPDRTVLDEIAGRKPKQAPKEFTRNEELERKKRQLKEIRKQKQQKMDEEEEPMAMGLFDL